jgi:hypothetical protein
MSYVVIGDESHIHAKAPCYGLGCFVVPADDLDGLEAGLASIFASHNITGELKWKRIGTTWSEIIGSVEAVEFLLSQGVTFHSMIVLKELYVKWQSSKEEAFYTTYYHLALHIATKIQSTVRLRIDQRSDKYPKHAEVLQIVTNHALARIKASSWIEGVDMVDSRQHRILQVVDVLLGAITADVNSHHNKGEQMNPGKRELVNRLAALFGWDRLIYDTFPNDALNIWHFPIQFRGMLPTREITVQLSEAV